MKGREDWGISPEDREREIEARERADREEERRRQQDIIERKRQEDAELFGDLEGEPSLEDLKREAMRFAFGTFRKINRKGAKAASDKELQKATDILKALSADGETGGESSADESEMLDRLKRMAEEHG